MTDMKSSVAMASSNGLDDKSKELQKEILMEKLRSKTSQYKNLAETSKAVRMAMLDKRWAVDSVDRMILQKCLDSLQHCIKVSSLQSLIERLECLARQLGLKFMVGGSGVELFISSDMFYLEVVLEHSGAVKDVKIHHEGKRERQSCEELVQCISRGDFADFTAQLEGLTAVYQLNAEKKVKCKAFSALQSLEEDLCTLGQLQSFIKDPWAQVHKSPIGFLQKRRGGHAMRLTYFVSPYELLDKEKGLQPLTVELLVTGRPAAASPLAGVVGPVYAPLGHSAAVLLEGSTANKLQVAPIVSVSPRPIDKSMGGPVYAALGLQNSSMLPACFTLKLAQPMPLCSALAKIIHATTEVEIAADWANAKPLLGLVVQNAYNKLSPGKTAEVNIKKGLFVHLPEQTHCYYMCEWAGLQGCTVASVPFTHPAHVPHLLSCLRQQALFNTLLASCVRPHTKQGLCVDPESALMFEVSALSWQHVSISLEHGAEESLATVELELGDAGSPRASVHTLSGRARGPLDEYVTRVLRASHSIPVMLRCLVKVWEREAAATKMNGGYPSMEGTNFSMGGGGLDPGGDLPRPEPHAPPSARHLALYPAAPNLTHQGAYMSDSQHSSQDSNSAEDVKLHLEDKKIKKRKSELDPWAGKKGKSTCDSDSESDNSDGSDNEDDNTMNSNTSYEEGKESPVSQNDFVSDVEMSVVDPSEMAVDSRMSDVDNSGDGDSENTMRHSFNKAEFKKQRLKKEERKPNPQLLLDLTESKQYMPSSVSITPIGSAQTSTSIIPPVFSLDRRPGIEIIPISSAAPAALPSSITITPISSSQAKSMDERHRSEKRSKSSEEKIKEKKKKKRREESMGPPEKVPPKQDPLTKPVSVSIKPTDGSPRSNSPNSLIRKFSPSPTHGRSVSISKSLSPSNIKNIVKPSGTGSHHNSPRHSPVPNSPKHLAGYSSPKSSTSSPKHSSSSSGKPSMSTLKSAASGSPSGKSTSGYDLSKPNKVSGSKDSFSSSSRDKEKKHSGSPFSSGRSSPKLKPSSVKLKQLEITPIMSDNPINEPLVSPPVEVNKANAPNQNRNRKGSLSAVIDKLKSAQHCSDAEPASKNPTSNKDRLPSSSKTQEYMVKPSSDGMKITINKTRTKESKPSLSNATTPVKQSSPQLTPPGQSSPKTHTGLKPGVISGPASKKTQVMQSSKSSSGGSPIIGSSKSSSSSNTSPSGSIGSSNTSKMSYSKSNSISGMNLSKSSSKGTGSPKSSNSDISKIMKEREREKSRLKAVSSGDKSLFGKERHPSPSGMSRDEVDGERSFKKDANFLVEGLMKPLDTSKFQIPKIKNQNTPDKSQFENRADFSSRSLDNKYQYPNARQSPDNSQKSAIYPLNVPKPVLNLGSSSPKNLPIDFTPKFEPKENPLKEEFQSGPYPLVVDQKSERKSAEMRPPTAGLARSGATTPQEAAEMLLDFSTSSGSKVSGVVAMRPVYPSSPALALHLAKSPAASPLVVPSPHSNSPCITDDELIDETVK